MTEGLHHFSQPGATPVDARGAPAAPAHAAALHGDDVVVLLLADLQPASGLWGFSRLVLGGFVLRGVSGLRFAKVLGSGHEGGFGVRPSATRHGLLTVFDGEQAADRFIDASPVVQGYRSRARECCIVKLRACSCRGSWNGRTIVPTLAAPVHGPIAALTRASIRPSKALRFWRLAPPAQDSLEASPGCCLAAGLGEAPLLRQATFSLWDSAQAMDDYARRGAHLEAIRRSASGQFFSESMFVRFVPLAIHGVWKGRRFG